MERSPTETGAKRRYLYLSVLVVVLDQWSKWWVERTLQPGLPRTVVPGFLDLTYVENTGVAFGLFPARGDLTATVVLAALGLAALVVVGLYFWKTPAREGMLLTGLALILGGAVGNLADRIATGSVTDFIDAYYGSYHWHTFNVADSAITVGIALMVIESLRGRGEAGGAEEVDAGGSSSADRPA